jgi:hypothetical protein
MSVGPTSPPPFPPWAVLFTRPGNAPGRLSGKQLGTGAQRLREGKHCQGPSFLIAAVNVCFDFQYSAQGSIF